MPLFGANCCSCSNENRMSFDGFEKTELLLIHLEYRREYGFIWATCLKVSVRDSYVLPILQW